MELISIDTDESTVRESMADLVAAVPGYAQRGELVVPIPAGAQAPEPGAVAPEDGTGYDRDFVTSLGEALARCMGDSMLTDRDKMLFLILALASRGSGSIRVSQACLAMSLGISKSATATSSQRLTRRGHVRVEYTRRPSPSGHGTVNAGNRYYLGDSG